MYRYIHNQLPSTYQKFFHLNASIHSYPSRNPNSFYIPFARTNTRLSSIKYAGPRNWNAIPTSIRSLPLLHIFKRKLRTYIINGAYVTNT